MPMLPMLEPLYLCNHPHTDSAPPSTTTAPSNPNLCGGVIRPEVDGQPSDDFYCVNNQWVALTFDNTGQLITNGASLQNFSQDANATLVINGGTSLNISGCSYFGGSLQVNVQFSYIEHNPNLTVINFNADCASGAFQDITVNVSGQNSTCYSNYAPSTLDGSLVIVFSISPTCGSKSKGGGFPWWGYLIIAIVIALAVGFVIVALTVTAVRQKIFPYSTHARSNRVQLKATTD